MKLPKRPFEYENLEEDFQVPYQNFGSFDAEILLHRYMNLTNAPRQLLQRRYTIHQW